jgi:hypothetical protein
MTMKKSLLLFGISLLFSITSIGQGEISLRIGDIDSRTLNPGDKVNVPVYCDNISGSIGGWQFYIHFDSNVLKFNKVINKHHVFQGDWFENVIGNLWAANWYDEALVGVEIGKELIFELEFEFLGGQSQITWSLKSEKEHDVLLGGETLVINMKAEAFKTELINGCVCPIE